MMAPLKPWQKILAYGSLLFIFVWAVFGIFAIWLLNTES